MGFYNRLFKPSTIGLIEKHLEEVYELLMAIPADVSLKTSSGEKIPALYHSIALHMRRRQISFIELEVIRARFHFQLSRSLLKVADRGYVISARDLLMASCDCTFYFDILNPSIEQRTEFFASSLASIDEFCRRWKLAPLALQDMNFLLVTFSNFFAGLDLLRSDAGEVDNGFMNSAANIIFIKELGKSSIRHRDQMNACDTESSVKARLGKPKLFLVPPAHSSDSN